MQAAMAAKRRIQRMAMRVYMKVRQQHFLHEHDRLDLRFCWGR